jgi:hypothetical protein
MTVAIGVMALAIPENAEDTWCPPKANNAKGIAVLNKPTAKQSKKNLVSLTIAMFLILRTMYKVNAPRTHLQKARPIGDREVLANSIKKNEEPHIRPAPK